MDNEACNAADRRALEQALLDAFLSIDREISRPDRDPWINHYKVQEMLFGFGGRLGQKVDTGFMFTLNQDLWPERYLYNNPPHCPGPVLPALHRGPNQRLFTTDIGAYSSEFIMRPFTDPAANESLRGRFNVIKLHGSFNWRTDDGRNAMVVGSNKGGQIEDISLLSWSWQIFRSVLSAGDVRLTIVGYGFGDEHVNAAIADAVENHGLKVFIWDKGNNLADRVQRSAHGDSIWNALLSFATREMIEVFPSNQSVTEEYQRIQRTVFD